MKHIDTELRNMISKLLNTFLLVFAVFGSSFVEAFTTNGPSTTFLRQSLNQGVKSPVLGHAGFPISSSALFGKKEARAQGNESKRKKNRVKKTKDDVIEVNGVVLESLPNAMFRLYKA